MVEPTGAVKAFRAWVVGKKPDRRHPMDGHPRIHGGDKTPAYAASPVRGTDTNVVQQEFAGIPRTLSLHMTHQVADHLSVLFRDPMKDGRVGR